jgi:hypothetical protein
MSTEFVFLEKKLCSRKKIVKNLRLKLRAWATVARALAHSFLDFYPKTVPSSTKFKRMWKFIQYPYSTIQGLFHSIICSVRIFFEQKSIPISIKQINNEDKIMGQSSLQLKTSKSIKRHFWLILIDACATRISKTYFG